MAPQKLLVVDDDADVRRVFATALRMNHEVEEASSGEQAIALLDGESFGLVLLDLHMPGVDGYAVLDHLSHSAGPNRDVPVIVVSADGTDETRTRALRSRSVHFLSKPVPLRVLTSLVDSTLTRAAQRTTRPPRA